jgi:hypothetical protein
MKKIFIYMLSAVAILSACKKHDYAAGTLSPIASVEVLRAAYKGSDLTLNKTSMSGAYQVTGVVISDFASGNTPAGLLVVQNTKQKRTRGIAIDLGSAASNYLPGDSLLITVEGAMLKKVNGGLRLAGISESAIQKLSANNKINVQVATTLLLNKTPDLYENTVVTINGAAFTPSPAVGDTYLGDKTLRNGNDNVVLHTEASAPYAGELLPLSVNATGVAYVNQTGADPAVIQIWPRSLKDIVDISDPVDPDPVASKYKIIIAGFANDVKGADGNYEYVQLLATTDIDFSKTPFSIVTCTNAGTAAPNAGAAPGAGWVTGGGRTYKFNLKSGIVRKGEFFYVGGSNKKINGANTTDISSAKWIRTISYGTTPGDGFGDASGGLMPNSGNAGGIALFSGTNLNEASIPLDVVFYGGTGKTTMLDEVLGRGYRVADNDRYSPVNSATSAPQPFFLQGTNSYIIPYTTADIGTFVKLSGTFNPTTKTWAAPRTFTNFTMTASSSLSDIQTGTIVLSN